MVTRAVTLVTNERKRARELKRSQELASESEMSTRADTFTHKSTKMKTQAKTFAGVGLSIGNEPNSYGIR